MTAKRRLLCHGCPCQSQQAGPDLLSFCVAHLQRPISIVCLVPDAQRLQLTGCSLFCLWYPRTGQFFRATTTCNLFNQLFDSFKTPVQVLTPVDFQRSQRPFKHQRRTSGFFSRTTRIIIVVTISFWRVCGLDGTLEEDRGQKHCFG